MGACVSAKSKENRTGDVANMNTGTNNNNNDSSGKDHSDSKKAMQTKQGKDDEKISMVKQMEERNKQVEQIISAGNLSGSKVRFSTINKLTEEYSKKEKTLSDYPTQKILSREEANRLRLPRHGYKNSEYKQAYYSDLNGLVSQNQAE